MRQPPYVVVALAAPLLGGCPPPAPDTPVTAPPVVEVASNPETPPEQDVDDTDDVDDAESETPEEVEEPEELSEEEKHQQEVADAVASLVASSPTGVSGGIVMPRGLGLGGSSGGWGMGHGSFHGPRVTVNGNDTEVRGGLSKDIIRRYVRKSLKDFKRCYEQRLVTDPTLEGRVVLRFVIATSGGVAQTNITEGLQDEVDRCIENVARRLVFPKPEGVVIVNYPFVFENAP